MMTLADRKELEAAAQRLSRQFAGIFSLETVEECVMNSYERLAATATVTGFLTILAERFALERLQALGLSLIHICSSAKRSAMMVRKPVTVAVAARRS